MNYQVIVETGPTELNAHVSLRIFGTEKTTFQLALISPSRKFAPSSRLEFNVSNVDVGKVRSFTFTNRNRTFSLPLQIEKINIGHNGLDQEWILKSVEIVKNDESYL